MKEKNKNKNNTKLSINALSLQLTNEIFSNDQIVCLFVCLFCLLDELENVRGHYNG